MLSESFHLKGEKTKRLIRVPQKSQPFCFMSKVEHNIPAQDDGIFQKLDDIKRTLVIAMTESKKQASITDYFTPMQ